MENNSYLNINRHLIKIIYKKIDKRSNSKKENIAYYLKNQRILRLIYRELEKKNLSTKRSRLFPFIMRKIASSSFKKVFYSATTKKFIFSIGDRIINIPYAYIHFILKFINFFPTFLKRIFLAYLIYISNILAEFLICTQQNKKAFFFVRVIRILFYPIYKEKNSYEKILYATTALNIGYIHKIVNEYNEIEKISHPGLSYLVGRAFLLNGQYTKAEKFLEYSVSKDNNNIEFLRYYGIALVLVGKKEAAKKIFLQRINLNPKLLVPHQNLAARYDLYIPKLIKTHLKKAGSFQIYDQLNFIAEQMFLFGNLKGSMHSYRQALLHQRSIRKNFSLPYKLINKLKHYPSFDSRKKTVILPIEWVTQIGHIALLDIFLKIEQTERKRKYNYILLAPKSMIANMHYLNYLKPYFVTIHEDKLIQELLPYQRYYGEGFMPFLHNNRKIEPWTRVGARTQVYWNDLNKAPLISLTLDDRQYGEEILRLMGIPQGAWFVIVHVREGTFYKEMKGGSSDHRNSNIFQYIEAIKEITKKGGWVIRMGDPKMTPLPKLDNVIDYALSPYKSEQMDIFLVATARLFIGTTSGLTTTALSFNTPALLLNVISNDWQLWTSKTHFIPKMIYDNYKKRILTISEVYTSEDRNLLINQDLIDRRQWKIIENTNEDILEAVRFKLRAIEDYHHLTNLQKELIQRYKLDMKNEPYMFGSADIVPDFLEKHPYLLSPIEKSL